MSDAKELARLVQDFIDANYPFHQRTHISALAARILAEPDSGRDEAMKLRTELAEKDRLLREVLDVLKGASHE